MAHALPPLATAAEVSAYLRTPLETLKYWRARRRGPAWVKVGAAVRYRREDVEQYLAANTQQPRSPQQSRRRNRAA
ncbi:MULTISPECIES: helix-turn-helix domain-containing protein [Actinosynnema]|uniref:Excisionase n=1 Tax=Actinosynnema pretiosum TaxID=42197 RepID=A0A290ZH97_9PSEU|nr:helix-turn-helix domain-containing protein [Actinosynnema pretiosum]ATE58377.1 excisionase [Actinosynnema pretiosum]MCP2098617.1 Helix-turn-helix domain-containing protein [Actinosynnema pretiosum]